MKTKTRSCATTTLPERGAPGARRRAGGAALFGLLAAVLASGCTKADDGCPQCGAAFPFGSYIAPSYYYYTYDAWEDASWALSSSSLMSVLSYIEIESWPDSSSFTAWRYFVIYPGGNGDAPSVDVACTLGRKTVFNRWDPEPGDAVLDACPDCSTFWISEYLDEDSFIEGDRCDEMELGQLRQSAYQLGTWVMGYHHVPLYGWPSASEVGIDADDWAGSIDYWSESFGCDSMAFVFFDEYPDPYFVCPD